MGGAYPVEQEPQGARPRNWVITAGTIAVAALLLVPVVWLVVTAGRAAGWFERSASAWVYAGIIVVIVALGVWLLFRFLRRDAQDTGG